MVSLKVCYTVKPVEPTWSTCFNPIRIGSSCHLESTNTNQWRLQEYFSGCSWVGLLYYNFFSLDSLLQSFLFQILVLFFFFFSFFFLLESNVMNTVLDTVSICLVERNISVLIYFNVPFQGISGFLKKIKNNIYLYLYFLIQYKIIDPNK